MGCDILYPIGGGSIVNNKELMYSLRSIEKHVKGVGDIYIIGKMPDWIKNVRHISFEDEHSCKETNIYLKTLRACQERSISDDFLFFNDDHFILADFIASEYPYYWKNELRIQSKGLRPGAIYKQAVDNTYRVLHTRGLNTINFDSHCPIIYNKDFFINEMPKYDWSGRISYILKSLYTNTKKIAGERMADCKIGSQHTLDGLNEIIHKRSVFSIGDGAIGPSLWELMETLYPHKSAFEK